MCCPDHCPIGLAKYPTCAEGWAGLTLVPPAADGQRLSTYYLNPAAFSILSHVQEKRLHSPAQRAHSPANSTEISMVDLVDVQ